MQCSQLKISRERKDRWLILKLLTASLIIVVGSLFGVILNLSPFNRNDELLRDETFNRRDEDY